MHIHEQIAGYIGELVRGCGQAVAMTVGVVQTAYANGSSTRYINDVLVRIFTLLYVAWPGGVTVRTRDL